MPKKQGGNLFAVKFHDYNRRETRRVCGGAEHTTRYRSKFVIGPQFIETHA